MYHYNKAIKGNRYEITVCDAGKTFILWDSTLQQTIATADNKEVLVSYAQDKELVRGNAIIIS